MRDTGRHADRLVGDYAARRFRIFLSVSETWNQECHRRVGRVGPEHRSSRRGRGEQRWPLRRRVGNMGACPPPLRGRSAVVAPNAAMYLFGQTIELHVDFDQVGASLRRPQRSERYIASFSESRSDCAKSHTSLVGIFGALCGPPNAGSCASALRPDADPPAVRTVSGHKATTKLTQLTLPLFPLNGSS